MIEVLNAQQSLLSNGSAKPFELQDFGLHELDKSLDLTPSPLIYVSSSPDFVTMKSEEVDYSTSDEDIFHFQGQGQGQGQSPGQSSNVSSLTQGLQFQQQLYQQQLQQLQHLQFQQQRAHNYQMQQQQQFLQQQQQQQQQQHQGFMIPSSQLGGGGSYFTHPKLAVPSQYPAMNNPNHQRSGSYNTAVNTPLPPSPIVSPIGSPGYQSPLTDDTEDDFMEPASPEERGEWQQNY